MPIGDENEEYRKTGCCWCLCCKTETSNPDFQIHKVHGNNYIKKPYIETGFLVPASKKPRPLKRLEELRRECAATSNMPSPKDFILRTNKKKCNTDFTKSALDMSVADVNSLLRRRLSLRVPVSEEDTGGEVREAILPQMNTFAEATPILLTHLVKTSSGAGMIRKSASGVDTRRSVSVGDTRKSSFRSDPDFRGTSSKVSFFSSKSAEDLSQHADNSVDFEQQTDNEFIDYLMTTSQFMKEALQKNWNKTKSYVRWVEHHVKTAKYEEQVRERTGEKKHK
ncbi:hypothetical protein PoB_007196800 [Plakobranchus ocellatus]|uniref:Uncharacterized protein n=1 Tax=Plakobranchus ocellatus TaxID=259542 RepID=A0AAV4DMC9_9GAST|nr:hypothetical protein PoB_007196800 [Plakobranchus ocellatus]